MDALRSYLRVNSNTFSTAHNIMIIILNVFSKKDIIILNDINNFWFTLSAQMRNQNKFILFIII
jgi:hypothetical protein